MTSKKDIIDRSRKITREYYCIYALIKNNKIVYIGQTSNIVSRLGQHINSKKDFDSWSIVEHLGKFMHTLEMNKIELKYIKKFKPKYNYKTKKGKYSV